MKRTTLTLAALALLSVAAPRAADAQIYIEFNTNLTYDLPLEDASVVPFVLSGLNVARVSTEGPNDVSDTEIGLNIGGGIKFDSGNLSPRITGRFNLFSSESFTLTFFVPFRVSD